MNVSNSTDAPVLKPRGGLNTSHHSDLDVDPSTDPSVLFGSGGTCMLGPGVTQGPYCMSPSSASG